MKTEVGGQKSEVRDRLADAIAIVTILSVALALATCSAGCVAGNKTEANLLKVEKPSAANEVDQYVTTAGRILDRLTRKDAE